MREYLLFHMIALTAGMVLDIAIGDPRWLPHPIRAIGALIGALERLLRRGEGKGTAKPQKIKDTARGAVLWLIVMAVTFAVSFGILAAAYRLNPYAGIVVEVILTFYILAAGSLRDESMKVFRALPDTGDARAALSMIVGRDTYALDEAGIIRAAVETVAENTSDGVIAPLIYTFLGGPVLGLCYKAVNTMDSMIGYHDSEYEYFGKVAARADDVANFIPARISALLMIASAGILRLPDKCNRSGKSRCLGAPDAFRIWQRDRYKHKSPNSAQTESVCAGALGVRLAGDASYKGVKVKKPYIGDDVRPVEAEDIKRAVRLMFGTECICMAVIFTITGLSLIIR